MGAHARLAMGVLIPSWIGVAVAKNKISEKKEISTSIANFTVNSTKARKLGLCKDVYLKLILILD